jgi:small subunit ribosomal protein S1
LISEDSARQEAGSKLDQPVVQPQNMSDLLQDYSQPYKRHRRGDVVEGVVVRVDREELLVDIGAKSEAVVPLHEIPRSFMTGDDSLHVGSQVLAYVLQPEDSEGKVVLSLSRAQVERAWRDLDKMRADGVSVEGTVVEHNKGGLIVTVLGVRGFVPLSQIADLRRSGDETVEQRLEAMKGRKALVKVIEINRRRNRLILSERAALQERRARDKERLLSELEPGEVRHGVVASICDFGAFVDLGGADGLLHLSELSWTQVTHPSQVLKVGQEVDVYVVGIDREHRKIALSLKRLQEEPWKKVSDKYQVGQIVDGKVTKLAAFGAFAQIEPGVEGLIHISELSEARVTHPRQVVREGEELRLRVIRIDPARHRLGLSLKQVDDEADVEATAPTAAAEEPEAQDLLLPAVVEETEARLLPNEADQAVHEVQETLEAPTNGEAEQVPERREAGVAES